VTSSHLLDGLIGAFVGAAVSAGALLFAQWRQHVKEGTAAVRALLVEMMRNATVALTVSDTAEQFFKARQAQLSAVSSPPNLSEIEKLFLKDYSDRTWSEQLPLLADRFDWTTLKACREAYSYASTYFYSIAADGDVFGLLTGAFATATRKFTIAIERARDSHKWIHGKLLRRAEQREFEDELENLTKSAQKRLP
jgi:hypothetical protein